jgi:serine/threonine protein kinase/Tfp pilus assembly protein PilF
MSDWQRVKSVFEEVIELPEEGRIDALRRICDGDSRLRIAVEDLLAAHDGAGDFLDAPTLSPLNLTGADPADVAPAELPARIGPYTPLDVTGEGGFGIVYRARQDEPVRRIVAVKVIKLGMDSREVITRFEGERQALAMMSHPNIAAVLDAGTTAEGRPYFVMEFVSGEPITTYCRKRQASLRNRLLMFMQVCHAVQHAHQKGIIHRDLKPSNVLVVSHDADAKSDSPQTAGDTMNNITLGAAVKVIDFGVAKAIHQPLTDHSLHTRQGMLIGTPAYMSPEQADMNQLDIDTRTDIYSLGVLLYELLAGSPPFDPRSLLSQSYSEIQRIIREVEPPRPSTRLVEKSARDSDTLAGQPMAHRRTLARQLRGDLDWIVMKCLEKDRARRYETAKDIALDIERYLSNCPILAGPPTLAYRFRKFARRNRAALLALSGIAAALIIGMGLAIAGFMEAIRQRDVAQEQRTLALKSAADAHAAARKAEAVNRFMLDMLAVADPMVSAQRDITAREAVEQAVAKLDAGSMKDQPVVEAGVRLTISRTFMGLAQYAAAMEQANRAMNAYRDLMGEQSAEYAEALQLRGSILSLSGKVEVAEPDFRAALAIQRAIRDPDDPAIAACLNDLATTLTSLEKFDESMELLAQAERIARSPRNTTLTMLPEVVNNIGMVYRKLGQWKEAGPRFREAAELNRAALGRLHPNVATNLDNLAQVLHQLGELDAAKASYDEALDIRRTLFGSDHPDVATTLHNLATLLWANRDQEGCEKAVRESHDIFRRIHGLTHSDTITVMHSLVSILGGASKLDEAEALLIESFEAVKDSPDVAFDAKHAIAQRLVDLNTARQDKARIEKWTGELERLRATSQPVEIPPNSTSGNE